jgi:hypothetical protein
MHEKTGGLMRGASDMAYWKLAVNEGSGSSGWWYGAFGCYKNNQIPY